MIHILDGQNNKILAVISAKHIIDNKHIQSLEHYLETFEFETFADQGFSEHLTKINRVIIPREDQGYHELVIDHSEKYNGDGGAKVRVHASGSYLMLKKATIIDPQTFTERSASMMLGIALNNTEFQPGIVESQAIRTFNISAHSDPFRLLKVIANEYGLELRFRIETDGGEVTGRYVDLIERNGEWRGRETVFGKDIENIRRIEKTDNIYTALRGLGPEDEDGNRLEVFVEDMDALQRWGRANPQTGELRHLVGVYEPQSSDFDMTIAQLTQYTRTELNKRINSVIEYEINVIDLENVVGEENKKMRYGDTIRIKDTTFNPPLYIDARVFEQERDITRRTHKRIKLGDFTEYTEEEVQAIWKSLQEQIKEKISQSQLFELTYDKPTIDGKDTQVKTDAEQDAIQKAEQAISVSKDHADQVASEAESNANNYTNTVKSQIDTDLLDKAGLEYVDGQLVLKADQSQVDIIETELNGAILDIADKADISYVDGQLVLKANQSQVDGLVQDIADKADLTYVNGQLTSKADKADTYTITQVDNALNSKVSTTQYTTDINGIVTDLNDHESRITQTETDITSKVSSTQYNQDISAIQGDISTLETTVGNHSTSINQNASAISLKANATDVYTKTQVDTSLSNKADASALNTIETRVSETEAELTVQANQITSKVSQTEYDADINGVVNRLDSAESSITQNANEISQRVTTTTYNAGMASKEGTVYKQNSAPTHLNGRLWLNTSVTPNILYRSTGSAWVKSTPTTANEVGAYSSSAGSSLANRVTTAESNITQNANAITLKASQSALDSLEGDVTQISSDVSSLQVGVNGITADVSSLETTINGHTTDISSLNSQLTVQANQISSKVDATFVSGAIADIEIGGRNLLRNSGDFIENGSYNTADYPLTQVLEHGELVTFRMKAILGGDKTSFRLYNSGGSGVSQVLDDYGDGTFGKTFNWAVVGTNSFVRIYAFTNTQVGVSSIEWVKLEKGNKATDWTPAPEDVQSEIDSVFSYAESETTQLAGRIDLKADSSTVNALGTRVNTAEQSINALDGAIQQRVTTSTFNAGLAGKENTVFKQNSAPAHLNDRLWLNTSVTPNILYRSTGSTWVKSTPTTASEVGAYSTTQGSNLAGRVSTAESTITQQADEIDLKVNKNGVIGAINLSSETARIQSANIDLVGAVTVLSDITGNLGTINAGTINGVNINGSAFNQTGANGSITLDDNGLIFDGANSSIEMNIITTSGWEDVASLVFKDDQGLRAMEIYQHYTDSVLRSDRALYVISGDQGLHLDGSAYENSFGSAGTTVDGGLKLLNVSGTNSALYINDSHLIGSSGDVNMTLYPNRSLGGFEVRSHANFNSYRTDVYVTATGTLQLPNTNSTSDNANVNINSNGSLQRSTSALKYKCDVEIMNESSDYVNQIQRLHLKSWYDKWEIENNGGLKNGLNRYYGLIADDVADAGLQEFVTYRDGQIDGLKYDRLWILLIPITKKLEKRVNYLEMENQVLKQRLNQLEGAA